LEFLFTLLSDLTFVKRILITFFHLKFLLFANCEPGSSVGIAADHGLDDPASNPGGDEIFRPSRPALGSTQPPVNGYRVFPGGKVRPGRATDHSLPSNAAIMEE